LDADYAMSLVEGRLLLRRSDGMGEDADYAMSFCEVRLLLRRSDDRGLDADYANSLSEGRLLLRRSDDRGDWTLITLILWSRVDSSFVGVTTGEIGR